MIRMVSFGRHSISVLLLTMVVIVACGSNSPDSTNRSARSQADLRSAVLAVDFAGAMAARSEFITLSSPSENRTGLAQAYVPIVEGQIGKEIPNRVLTPGELNRLGIWRFDDGTITMWQLLIGDVASYYSDYGEIPPTGADLYPDLLTENGYEEFMQMNRQEALREFRNAIDPITGKFYSSFVVQEWQAGAMCISVITDPLEIERIAPRRRIPVPCMLDDGTFTDASYEKPQAIWNVRIYGEVPGTVLFEGHILK